MATEGGGACGSTEGDHINSSALTRCRQLHPSAGRRQAYPVMSIPALDAEPSYCALIPMDLSGTYVPRYRI